MNNEKVLETKVLFIYVHWKTVLVRPGLNQDTDAKEYKFQ